MVWCRSEVPNLAENYVTQQIYIERKERFLFFTTFLYTQHSTIVLRESASFHDFITTECVSVRGLFQENRLNISSFIRTMMKFYDLKRRKQSFFNVSGAAAGGGGASKKDPDPKAGPNLICMVSSSNFVNSQRSKSRKNLSINCSVTNRSSGSSPTTSLGDSSDPESGKEQCNLTVDDFLRCNGNFYARSCIFLERKKRNINTA